ncbi:MAG: hypothetical protein K0S54_3767 [Alphaproteobacteria bacterium]|nr:hypothetical protein [Alphaproteobacteria bacterium]
MARRHQGGPSDDQNCDFGGGIQRCSGQHGRRLKLPPAHALHKAGKHAESEAALIKAEGILGIKK